MTSTDQLPAVLVDPIDYTGQLDAVGAVLGLPKPKTPTLVCDTCHRPFQGCAAAVDHEVATGWEHTGWLVR